MKSKQAISFAELGVPLSELARLAGQALRQNDESLLEQIDNVLHFHFIDQVLRRKAGDRQELMSALLEVGDVREVRKTEAASTVEKAVRWQHLFELLHTLDIPDHLDEARAFVDGRDYGWKLLRIVKDRDDAGNLPNVGELARLLGTSPSSLVQLLGKMEPRGLIQRLRVGQNVMVGIGSIGEQLLETRVRAVDITTRQLPAKSTVNEPLGAPESYLKAAS